MLLVSVLDGTEATKENVMRWIALVLCTVTTAACAAAAASSSTASDSGDVWKETKSSSTIDPHALPLGNGRYRTDAPQRGYMFACDAKLFQFKNVVGATKIGAWVGASTFDMTAKPSVQGSVTWGGKFSITTSGDTRVFTGNGLPAGVATGVFPTAAGDPAYEYDKNPFGLVEQSVAFSVPLHPRVAARASCTGLEVGITLDGVELSGPLDSSGRDEMAYEMMDACSGMTQPGGLYHRHALSTCTPHIHERNALVGYALDGFGIFSPFDADGRELRTADLDECHGRTSSVVWDGVEVEMYHYVLTRDFPYSVSCFRGEPVSKSFPPLPPPPMGAGAP